MPLATTTIGAWPKPAYVRLPDWFTHPDGPDAADPTREWAAAMEALGEEAEAIIARGVAEAIEDQVGAGIDIPTDGEIARENYIHYHCRRLAGVSFDRLEDAVEITERLGAALDHIDAHRLIAAPDCGLGLLGRDRARSKLAHLCRAARGVGGDAGG